MTRMKREGDGATPIGRFELHSMYRRNDGPASRYPSLGCRAIRPDDIWCDTPGHPLYNRRCRGHLSVSHENLWRNDHIYDVIVVLDYNMRPRVHGRGSAIFFHLTREPPAPTAGCVAISAAAMRRLLPRLRKGAVMLIRR